MALYDARANQLPSLLPVSEINRCVVCSGSEAADSAGAPRAIFWRRARSYDTMPQTRTSIFKMKELSKTPAVRRELVGEEEATQRVDNYLLRHCKGVPKSHVYQILRSGQVRVNGRRVGPDYRLHCGDEVRIPPLRVAERAAPAVAPSGRSFRVLFEDEAIVAIDKPAGVAVHGGSGISFGIIEQLRQQRPESRFWNWCIG